MHEHSLPGSLLAFRIGNLSNISDTDIEARLVRSSRTIFPAWVHTDPLPLPKYMTRVMPQNREKSYSRFLQTPISNVWRTKLQSSMTATAGSRLSAYINIAGNDLYRPNLFKPAPYILEDTTISTKCLFRLRTQHSIEIPTHQHLTTASGRFGYTKYEDRHCPLCTSGPVVGSETHFLLVCPGTAPILEAYYAPLKRLLSKLALPPWDQISDLDKVSLLLGGSLPRQWKTNKTQRDHWRTRSGDPCALIALKLSTILKDTPTTVRPNRSQ